MTRSAKPLQSEEGEDNMGKSSWILEEDKWMLPLVKRTRTEFDIEGQCSRPNWTQVLKPESFSSSEVHVHEEFGWSLDTERLPGRACNEKENYWHNNLEKRLAGKRKICDINGNLDNNLECSWPLFTETSDEEDNDGKSDSETYSGPS